MGQPEQWPRQPFDLSDLFPTDLTIASQPLTRNAGTRARLDQPSSERRHRPRVLFIITRFVNGGAERDTAEFIRALRSDGYEVELVVGADSCLDTARRLCRDISIEVEPHLRRAIHPYHDAIALARLARLVRRKRFQVVVTCTSKAGIIGRIAARLAGARLIFHSLVMANSGEGFGTVSSVVFRAAERLVGRWTDGYFTVGEDLRDRYIRARVAVPKRYHIVRSPIDFRRFLAAAERGRNAARQELGLDEGRSVIAYVGRLEERKGVRDLPNYLRAVCELVPVPPIFLIAGDGELRADLERTFEEAGTRNDVVFLGYSDSVPTVLAAADCLVLLSRAEGLPQVLVQAAATCTPFVSYPVDGAAELRLRGATGEVVPFGAWQAAAQATIRFLNAPRPESIDLTEWDAREVEKQFKSLFAQLTERCRYPQDVDGRQRAA